MTIVMREPIREANAWLGAEGLGAQQEWGPEGSWTPLDEWSMIHFAALRAR